MTDYYTTLGVDRSADPDTIKRAYRKLAAQHHPDRGGDTNRFQEIQAAYDTLSDPQRRQEYDNPQPQGFQFHFGGGFPGGFGSIFEQHFGPGHPFGDIFGGRPNRNRTLNLQTTMSLEDAYYGKSLVANITLPSGKEQVIDVKIPPGVADGTVVRLSGIGDDSIPNIPRGDIHLTVHIPPHPIFRRDGDNLIRDLQLNCIDAMLGKIVEIETITRDKLQVNIRPGTQHGQLLSIQGHGMPNLQDQRIVGKMLLDVKITIPTMLTEQQKDLLQQIKI
jgi:DnaJ-class molecular chaperone